LPRWLDWVEGAVYPDTALLIIVAAYCYPGQHTQPGEQYEANQEWSIDDFFAGDKDARPNRIIKIVSAISAEINQRSLPGSLILLLSAILLPIWCFPSSYSILFPS
jgi:hypothetical protein